MFFKKLKKILCLWIETNHCLLHYLFYYKKPSRLSPNYEEYWDDYQSKEIEMKFTGDPDETPLLFNILSARYSVAKAVAKLILKEAQGQANQMMLLDVGCGDGAIINYLHRTTGIKVCGVDISEKAVNFLKEKYGFQSFVADMSKADIIQREVGEYDFILITEFIEHIKNSEEILLALKEKCRRGLIISIPNTGYYFDRLRLLLGRFPIQWRFHPAEHLRYFTVKDFKWLAKFLGFEIKAIKPYYGIPILREIFPNLFARYALFYLGKKDDQDLS